LLGCYTSHAIYLTFAELGFSGMKSLSRTKKEKKKKVINKKKFFYTFYFIYYFFKKKKYAAILSVLITASGLQG